MNLSQRQHSRVVNVSNEVPRLCFYFYEEILGVLKEANHVRHSDSVCQTGDDVVRPSAKRN
jgi:hypothetical protein